MVEGIGNLFRFMFVFIGLIFTDFVLSEKNSNNHVISTEETIIFQKTFKKSSWHTLYITFIMFVSYVLIFLGVIAINLIFNPDLEINLFQSGDFSQEQISGLVTPFAEELFFRGFIISCFISASYKSSHFRFKIKRYNISLIAIMGVIVSTIMFARIHVVYYDEPLKMQGLIVVGLVLGFYFMLWRDLSACVLCHFFINVLALRNIVLTVLTLVSFVVFYLMTYLYYDVIKKSNKEGSIEMKKTSEKISKSS